MHSANYITLGLLIACMLSAAAMALRNASHIEADGKRRVLENAGHRIRQKISRPPPKQERKAQKRSGLTFPVQSLRLDIMPRKRGTAGHSSHPLYNVCK
jgi:hypothetical protein